MNWKVEHNAEKFSFDTLNCGDLFIVGVDLYVKTDDIKDADGFVSNAVSIYDGLHVIIEDIKQVIKVKSLKIEI